ncbi:MAG: ATP-grasp domain-containing protein [Gemmataceae bacterium]|nr:ATP-grasp domain-containing protein [Gemmataceae bacterium]MCI0743162.1 ATP-grasp domain-containing protein [Gemmataceae bacterium]
MAAPHVLVLYNRPLLPLDHPDADSEHLILEGVRNVTDALDEAGYRVSEFGLKHDPRVLWTELRRRRPRVVFNLFEGHCHDPETESYVAGLLQWRCIPFTGSPMHTLSLARAKDWTKQLLRGNGLPTPDFLVVDELPIVPCSLTFPVIVKPARTDASVGLNQDSVCTNQEQLENRVAVILEAYGSPVLVEEFVDGREFNVALVELPELELLPPGEIVFAQKEGVWPILTYDGKWKPDSIDYQGTPTKYPADIDPKLSRRLGALAKRAYRLLGCRDYARVDFRVNAAGKPFILEVNPNPDISIGAGFATCLAAVDISYAEFVARLVEHARRRPGNTAPKFLTSPVLNAS